MSWSWKIGILYGSFVAFIVTMVLLTYTGKVELVDKDYYRMELNYQKTIDARNRALHLEKEFQIAQNASEVWIECPISDGKVHWYCNSDASKDFRSSIGEKVSKTHLRKGNYKVSIHWGTATLDSLVEISTFIE